MTALARTIVLLSVASLCWCGSVPRAAERAAPRAVMDAVTTAHSPSFHGTFRVPTRDGVHLATDVYLPTGAAGPFPVILIRTPYNKNAHRPAWFGSSLRTPADLGRLSNGSGVNPVEFYGSRGYAVVVQDFRGRWESSGKFTTGKFERRDFEDTMTWLDAQPWSARRVGMWGCSYLGHSQVVGAAAGTPSLKAITPMSESGSFSSAVGRYTMLWHYSGGAREFWNLLTWYGTPGSVNYYLKPDPDIPAADWARFAHLYRQVPEFQLDHEKIAWELPLLGALDRAGLPPTDWNNVLSNPPESRYWHENSELVSRDDRIHAPALWIQNWNDVQSAETVDAFRFARERAANEIARANQYLIMGPGYHCGMLRSLRENMIEGDLSLGDARFDIWDAMLRWNDRWVKGDPDAMKSVPRVRYWLYGRNEWRSSTDMPLPGTRYRKLYLSSNGHANTAAGDGVLSFNLPKTAARDEYTYDPANPVRTPKSDLGGWRVALTDQRETATRPDVLVYTTEPLKAGLTIVGPLKLHLWITSSAKDTDFTGKLVDVHPDGRAIQLQTGILRVRYRNSFEKPELMSPGTVYPIVVDLNATANYFAPGHRLRIEVSSSNFPRFDRNLNTGGNNYDETSWVTARNAVLTGPATPSHLALPVVPD